MMGVLMFVPQYPYPVVGGLEKQSHELTKALMRRAVSVQVLSGRIGVGQPGQALVEGVPVTRVRWSDSRLVRALATPASIAGQMWHHRRSFDIVHVHQHSWVSLYAIVIAKLLGKQTLAKLANVGDFGLPGMRRGPLGRFKQAILLWSDAIVAMSLESLAELEAAGYPPGRVLGSPNGIRLGVRREAPRPEGRPCQVVFVGRLSEEKQLDRLLDAWAGIADETPGGPHLHIWGQGPLEAELRLRAAELDIERHVTFGGHVSNVADRLTEMDVFVLPSRAEGNSNAILEAMAAGLPVVSTNVGGTAMQVGEEGREFLCDPSDTAELKDALTRLISNPQLRRSLGSAMLQRVERDFDIDKVAAIYESAYRLLAERRGASVSSVSNPVLSFGSQ